MNAPLSPEAARLMAELDAGRIPGSPDGPAASGSLGWPQLAQVSLCAVGLARDERGQLEHLVAVSQHRRPRIELLPVGRAHEADVILLDADDEPTVAWSARQDWLASRSVLWLGRTPVQPGHAELHRPIPWAMLPIVLARAIHAAPPRSTALVARTLQPQAPAVLVLGSEPGVRARLRWLVESTGRRVTAAASAREGLAALHAAAYDAVLLADAVDDLDGAAVCRRVRALERRIGRMPVLMLESAPGAWSRMRARLAGFDAVRAMPAGEREMADLLDRYHAVPRPKSEADDDPPSTQPGLP